MREVLIGEAIRQRRLELGMTQEQLGEGIFDPVSISRIETGKQTPSRKKLKELFERLGLPGDYCYVLRSNNAEKIVKYREEIISLFENEEYEEALGKLEELKKLSEAEDHVTQQFILLMQCRMGKMENGERKSYTFQEQFDLLQKAIRLTSPAFDINKVEQGLYNLEEMAALTLFAKAYSDNGDSERAISIYKRLLIYLHSHFPNILNSEGIFPLVAYCYAKELDKKGEYEKAFKLAKYGWQSCVRYEFYGSLFPILALIAQICHHMGDDEQSEIYYRRVYYIYKVIGDKKGENRISREVKQTLKITLQ